jgi:hypothetical protein
VARAQWQPHPEYSRSPPLAQSDQTVDSFPAMIRVMRSGSRPATVAGLLGMSYHERFRMNLDVIFPGILTLNQENNQIFLPIRTTQYLFNVLKLLILIEKSKSEYFVIDNIRLKFYIYYRLMKYRSLVEVDNKPLRCRYEFGTPLGGEKDDDHQMAAPFRNAQQLESV